MAYSLLEAREVLLDSVLHVGDCGFSDKKVDRAIRRAFERFLRETGLNRTTATVTVSSGAYTGDVSAVDANFLYTRMYDGPYLAPDTASTPWQKLTVVSLQNLRGEMESTNATTGRPELLAWTGDAAFTVFPVTDAAYDIVLPYRSRLTEWTVGTDDPASVSLNVSEEYFDDVLWTGGKYALIGGAPGHPDAEQAGADFERLILKVKGETHMDGVLYVDPTTDLGISYGPRGPI